MSEQKKLSADQLERRRIHTRHHEAGLHAKRKRPSCPLCKAARHGRCRCRPMIPRAAGPRRVRAGSVARGFTFRPSELERAGVEIGRPCPLVSALRWQERQAQGARAALPRELSGGCYSGAGGRVHGVEDQLRTRGTRARGALSAVGAAARFMPAPVMGACGDRGRLRDRGPPRRAAMLAPPDRSGSRPVLYLHPHASAAP